MSYLILLLTAMGGIAIGEWLGSPNGVYAALFFGVGMGTVWHFAEKKRSDS